MKKKKGEIEISTNAIILIILMIIVLVVLIIGFSFGWEKIAPWLDETHFKIYKQECLNLSNEEKCQLIFGEDSVAISRKEGGFNCYHNLKPGEYNYSWWTPYFDTEEEINLSSELCRQVLVDEIFILEGYKCDASLCSKEIAYWMPKEHLTTEWLDENCECKWYVCKNNEDYDCEIQNRIFCRKYKCGEVYYVKRI